MTVHAILTRKGSTVGIIPERDIVRALSAMGRAALETSVAQRYAEWKRARKRWVAKL